MIKQLLPIRKCDKAMRRSKERCLTPLYTRWRCPGDCASCVCALVKQADGIYIHTPLRTGHSNGKKVENDE